MLGMEKMLSNMIGMTPDEMKALSGRVSEAVFTSAEAVGNILKNTETIITMMEGLSTRVEALENDDGNNRSDRAGKRPARRGNGGSPPGE